MPNEVRCYNRQYDLSDMINVSRFFYQIFQKMGNSKDCVDFKWECHADLDSQVRFHDFKVQCEGYDHDYPFDAYIIEGSCSLQFSLESKAYMNIDYYRKDFYETSRLSNFLTLIIMAIVFLAIYRSCNKNRANQELRREFQNGYGINPENPDINLGNSFPAPPPPYASLGLTGPELKPDNIPAVNVVNSTHANGETTRWSSFLTGNVIGVAPSSTQSQITSAEQQPASPRTASNNLNSIISVSRRSESPPPPYISQGSLTNPTSTINTSR
jgi:hypothetical protein